MGNSVSIAALPSESGHTLDDVAAYADFDIIKREGHITLFVVERLSGVGEEFAGIDTESVVMQAIDWLEQRLDRYADEDTADEAFIDGRSQEWQSGFEAGRLNAADAYDFGFDAGFEAGREAGLARAEAIERAHAEDELTRSLSRREMRSEPLLAAAAEPFEGNGAYLALVLPIDVARG